MLDGFNVTIPHKTGIIPMLDGLSQRAQLFGAVNTVKIENGKATGHNTDCFGFLRALENGRNQPWRQGAFMRQRRRFKNVCI